MRQTQAQNSKGREERIKSSCNYGHLFQLFVFIVTFLIFANGTNQITGMLRRKNKSNAKVLLMESARNLMQYHQYSNDIHIFFASDESEKIALYTVINSIIVNHNTSHSRLYFHILVEYNQQIFIKELNHLFMDFIKNDSIKFEIKQFSNYPQYFNFYKDYTVQNSANKRLLKSMNFARFYFVDIFDLDLTVVKKAIYLDLDMIVQADIQKLYDHEVNESMPIQSPFHVKGYALNGFNLFGKATRHKKLVKILNISKEVKMKKSGFNTGIYLYDLQHWKRNNLTQKSQYFIKLNHKYHGRLWALGTQPIMNMLYVHDEIGRISKRWNVKNLGYEEGIKAYKLKRGYVLHWNGQKKPWNKDALKEYKGLWLKYLPNGFNQQAITNWSDKWDLPT